MPNYAEIQSLLRSQSEPVHFGRRWCEGPAPGGGGGGCSTLDKTEEILYDILFICSHIDEMLFKINEFF